MKVKGFHYGMSLAANWAWGTSLIVGMELVQTKGVIPFAIWAVANSMALPLFGFLAYRIKYLERIITSKPVTAFTTIVLVFCIWIQMNAIYQQALVLTDNRWENYLRIGIIIFFLLLIIVLHNNGVIRSIIMNNPLWFVCYILLLIVALYGVITSQNVYELSVVSDAEDIRWAVNSCFILFSGPLMSIPNWQAASIMKKENVMYQHYVAGGLFAIYMVFVGILAAFRFDGFMKAFLCFIVMIVALTTADGAIAGMKEIGGQKIGAVLAVISVIFWPCVLPAGVMGLWTTMGNMRIFVAGVCIVKAVLYAAKKKEVSQGK